MNSSYRSSPHADACHEIVVEPHGVFVGAREPARERDAHRLQRPVVQVAAAAVTGRERVGHEPRAGRHPVERLIEEPGVDRPPHEIAVADTPRDPGSASAREHDVASGLVQFLGDLAARLAAADHQHVPLGKSRRVRVARDVEHGDVDGERGKPLRPVGPLERAARRGEHAGADRPVRGVELEPVVDRAHAGHLDAGAHGQSLPVRVALEERDDLVARHVAVRLVAVVRAAGKVDRPVGRDQPKRVPPRTPGRADAVPFQHDVFDPTRGERRRERESGVTRPDDDDIVAHRGSVRRRSRTAPTRGGAHRRDRTTVRRPARRAAFGRSNGRHGRADAQRAGNPRVGDAPLDRRAPARRS